MCRCQDVMLQRMAKKFVTNHKFKSIKEKVDDVLNDIVPKITSNATNDMIDDNLMRLLGWLLEEIHVTWTQFGKKRTRIQLCTKFDIKKAYNAWRWRRNSLRRRLKAQATVSGTPETASE
ncbi:hypothetical protein Tco_1535528 [Tanacetum coccineum]